MSGLEQVETVDIDISAAAYDVKGKILGIVSGQTPSRFGISHSGEAVGGEAEYEDMDDEYVNIDLQGVPADVVQIFIAMTFASGTFEQVESAYARVQDQTMKEVIRYECPGGRKDSGLIIGRVFRDDGAAAGWKFQPLGRYCEKEGIYENIRKCFRRVIPETKTSTKRITCVDDTPDDHWTKMEGAGVGSNSSYFALTAKVRKSRSKEVGAKKSTEAAAVNEQQQMQIQKPENELSAHCHLSRSPSIIHILAMRREAQTLLISTVPLIQPPNPEHLRFVLPPSEETGQAVPPVHFCAPFSFGLCGC